MAALAYHTASPTVVIRAARGSDGPALRRLAELDSREVPTGDVLIAETDDELVAALSLTPASASPTRSATPRTSSTCWPTVPEVSAPDGGV